MGTDKPAVGKIRVTTKHQPMSVFQMLVKPVIEIDGERFKRWWGEHEFEVPVGAHTVKCYHRWFFFSKCHASEVDVKVLEGQTINLTWTTPLMVMSEGVFEVDWRTAAATKPSVQRTEEGLPIAQRRPDSRDVLCPHCNEEVELDEDDIANESFTCPTCNKQVVIECRG